MHSWVQVVSVTVDTSATNPRLPSNISIWRVSSPLRKVPRRLLNIVPEGIRDTEEFTWMAESERDEGGRELRWRSVDMGGGVLEGNINLPNKGCIMVDSGEKRVNFEMSISAWLPRLVVKVVERLVLRREVKALVAFAVKEKEREKEIEELLL